MGDTVGGRRVTVVGGVDRISSTRSGQFSKCLGCGMPIYRKCCAMWGSAYMDHSGEPLKLTEQGTLEKVWNFSNLDAALAAIEEGIPDEETWRTSDKVEDFPPISADSTASGELFLVFITGSLDPALTLMEREPDVCAQHGEVPIPSEASPQICSQVFQNECEVVETFFGKIYDHRIPDVSDSDI